MHNHANVADIMRDDSNPYFRIHHQIDEIRRLRPAKNEQRADASLTGLHRAMRADQRRGFTAESGGGWVGQIKSDEAVAKMPGKAK